MTITCACGNQVEAVAGSVCSACGQTLATPALIAQTNDLPSQDCPLPPNGGVGSEPTEVAQQPIDDNPPPPPPAEPPVETTVIAPVPVEVAAPEQIPEPVLALTVVETVLLSPMPLPSLELAETPVPPAGSVEEEILTVVAVEPEESIPLDFVDPSTKPRPLHRIHSPAAVYFATLVGGVLAGCFILAYTYQSLRRKRAARAAAGFGILIAGAFLALIFAYPSADRFPELRTVGYILLAPLWVAGSPHFGIGEKLATLAAPLVMYFCARYLQGGLYTDYLREGGRRAPILGAGGIALICSAVIFAGLCVQAAVFPPGHDIHFRLRTFGSKPNEVRVYSQDGLPDVETDRLGKLLIQLGPLDTTGITTVWVWRNGEGRILSFVMDEDAWEDPQLLAQMRARRALISTNAFGGRPIRMEFCDEHLTRKRLIR